MKQFLGLMLCLLFLNGCDDGNMTFTALNFPTNNIQKCDASNPDLLFKINGSEALMLNFPVRNFPYQATTPGAPLEYTIGNNGITLTYRLYNSTLTASNLCSPTTAGSPNVTEQWTAAAGGKVYVSTTVNPYIPTTPPDLTLINPQPASYTQHIVLKNVTLTKGDETMILPEYILGDYIITNPFQFRFRPTISVQKCTTNNSIYSNVLNEAVVLQLPAAAEATLFANQETATGTSRQLLISDATIVRYRLFDANITNNYFCSTLPPSSPTLIQELTPVNGTIVGGVNTTGIINVTTVKVVNPSNGVITYEHTVTLQEVTFVSTGPNINNIISRYFASLPLGVYTVTPPVTP